MNLKEKLLIIYNIILNYSEKEKKFELFQAHIELKGVFAQATFSESLFETLDRLKNNLVYKEFELENDPEFFKGILKKIDDPSIYNELLEAIPKIKCSSYELEVFNQQLPKFELFFEFEDALKKETGSLYKLCGNDLYQLHGIVFSDKIKHVDKEWFLKSPFLKLLPESSIFFQKSFYKVLKYLVRNVYSPLAEKNTLKASIQANTRNPNMFYFQAFVDKDKAKALSSTAKDALKNSLKEYITPINSFRH